MSALDLMLPGHLYMEKRDEHGDLVDVIYLHDRLINWFDHGRGVTRLCDTVCSDQLAQIDNWEETQLLQLEEQWHAVETGEDDADNDNERHYHLACDAVTAEAAERRTRVREERDQRHNAIECLVADCTQHLEDNAPPPPTSHATEYTVAIVLAVVVAFALL